MAGSSIRDVYAELLLERVRADTYPNPDHLDRIEATVRFPGSGAQVHRDPVEQDRGDTVPEGAILDRVERFALMG